MSLCLSGGRCRVHSRHVESHSWRGHDTNWLHLWWDDRDVLRPQHRLLLWLGRSSCLLLLSLQRQISDLQTCAALFEFHVFFCFFLSNSFRSVSCTTTPTQASTTTMMRRAVDTSFTPGLSCLLLRLQKNLTKTRAPMRRRAGNWRRGSKSPQSRIIK